MTESALTRDPIGAFTDAIERAQMAGAELFCDDVVLDATVPNSRFQVCGASAVGAELWRWFADPGQFEELHLTLLPDGEILEFTLPWEEGGVPHACHQAHVLTVRDGRIGTDRVWCGGRWPASLLAEMERRSGPLTGNRPVLATERRSARYPVASSIDELLAGAIERRPMRTADSKSGARFEWVNIAGEGYVVKHLHVDDDWIMRALVTCAAGRSSSGNRGCWRSSPLASITPSWGQQRGRGGAALAPLFSCVTSRPGWCLRAMIPYRSTGTSPSSITWRLCTLPIGGSKTRSTWPRR